MTSLSLIHQFAVKNLMKIRTRQGSGIWIMKIQHQKAQLDDFFLKKTDNGAGKIMPPVLVNSTALSPRPAQ